MSLQIITGNLLYEKKQRIVKHLIDISQQQPEAKIYYLVPDHIKFDMESFILEEIRSHTKATSAVMLNIQVVSFKRLEWFLLSQQSKKSFTISEIGMMMIIRQVLEKHQDDLVVYQGQQHHLGFVEKLFTLFDELLLGNISPEELVYEQIKEDDVIFSDMESQRLKELQLLYQSFCQELQNRHIDNYRSFDEVQHFLKETVLQEHYLVIDHHYYFDAQQYQLILSLIQSFTKVWVCLPLSAQQVKLPHEDPTVYRLVQTYLQLKSLTKLIDCSVEKDWLVEYPAIAYHSDMVESAKWLHNHFQIKPATLPPLVLKGHLQVFKCDTIQTEIQQVCFRIRDFVINHGYRYRDIRIITRDMQQYETIVAPYFNQQNIPYFFDHASKMNQHAIVILIEALLQLKSKNWRYSEIMTILKSELIMPDFVTNDVEECRFQKALFENILIENGFFGYRFYQESYQWNFTNKDQIYYNAQGQATNYTIGQIVLKWRNWFLTTLQPLFESWKNNMTGGQAAEWCYQLLTNISLHTQLESLRDQAIEQGDLVLSRRHEQVWQVTMNVLDEFYLLYADTEISYQLFLELMMTSFNQATYHIIPPTLDQVTVTNIESPQVSPAKITFVIGVSHTMLPKMTVSDSLLTGKNREYIQEQLLPHQYLPDRVQQHNQMETFLAQQLLLSATDYLFISVAIQQDQQTVKLSPYIESLVKEASLEIKHFEQSLLPSTLKDTIVPYFTNYTSAMPVILKKIRLEFEQNNLLTAEWIQLIKKVIHSDKGKELQWDNYVTSIFDFYQLPYMISTTTAKQLYGDKIQASVSKIEQYFKDPFSYFLTYGLKIRQRDIYQMNPMKLGDYYHTALEMFFNTLQEKNTNLSSLTQNQLDDEINQLTKQLMVDERYNLLRSHPRMIALQSIVHNQLHHFIQMIKYQQKLLNVQTLRNECLFGFQTDIHKTYSLLNGKELNLSGKIDRIDLVSQNYLQVIDYKSGQTEFDLQKFYYGLDLQILTYLQVVNEHYGSQYQLLGGFYQPIIQKYTQVDTSLAQQLELYSNENDQKSNYVQTLELAQNRLSGFVVLPASTMLKIDSTLAQYQKSSIYPIVLKKDNSYHKQSKVFLKNDSDDSEANNASIVTYEDLMNHLDRLYQRAGDEILSGNIAIRPYEKLINSTLSLQNNYRVISGFDATEHSHLYRQLEYTDQKVLLQLKKEKGESND